MSQEFPALFPPPNGRLATPVPGYVRSEGLHLWPGLNVEVQSEERKVAVLTIRTVDGPISVGLDREGATTLMLKLRLFLKDFPPTQAN
jgi:hypothetical protein